eukprot:8165422-Alexandrium_andersonii.AAC.1
MDCGTPAAGAEFPARWGAGLQPGLRSSGLDCGAPACIASPGLGCDLGHSRGRLVQSSDNVQDSLARNFCRYLRAASSRASIA